MIEGSDEDTVLERPWCATLQVPIKTFHKEPTHVSEHGTIHNGTHDWNRIKLSRLDLAECCIDELDHASAFEKCGKDSDEHLDRQKIQNLVADVVGRVVDGQKSDDTGSHVYITASNHRCGLSHEQEAKPPTAKGKNGRKSKCMEPVHFPVLICAGSDRHCTRESLPQGLEFSGIGIACRQQVDEKWRYAHCCKKQERAE
mmetsp:Transcript_5068/g.14419  ORF Transcript_5068/g.14419 Transcript_5068/m.14419 type:complete len:200 (+) Transcript_5068:419-1018(+)